MLRLSLFPYRLLGFLFFPGKIGGFRGSKLFPPKDEVAAITQLRMLNTLPTLQTWHCFFIFHHLRSFPPNRLTLDMLVNIECIISVLAPPLYTSFLYPLMHCFVNFYFHLFWVKHKIIFVYLISNVKKIE